MWRRDGRELYYRAGNTVMASRSSLAMAIASDYSQVLFPVQTAPGTRLAAAPERQPLLAIQAEPGSEPARLESC